MCKRRIGIALVGILAVGVYATPLVACPFCSAVSQTFSEEIDSMDAVVIARLVEPPPPAKPGDASDEVPRAKFEVAEILKGDALIGNRKSIETIYFGEAKKGEQFLIMGVDPPNLMWSTPLQLSERGRKYVSQLTDLAAEGPERLRFFQDFLEDKDEMLARDAYDEFARAPYDTVRSLKGEMNHDELLSWIQDPNVPASRRRLYLTMLGVCGTQSDLPMLESMLKSDDRKLKSGLDALIGCYLTLKGPSGLPLVDELYLKNSEAEYADTYAAIMALRFHGTEGGVIPRQRVLESLHYMLDRPQLADLVIPDLARWEDWSQMEKLVALFKSSDDKTSWVRVPVINYLRACPRPEAKTYLDELEKIDPASVKRANTFFPFTPAKSDATEKPKTSQSTIREADMIAEVPAGDSLQVGVSLATASDSVPERSAFTDSTTAGKARDSRTTANTVAKSTRLSSPTLAVQSPTIDAPNRIVVVGVTWVIGVILLLLQWTLLGGARPTAS